jgi:hypothetical protein
MYNPQDIEILTHLGYSENNIMHVHRFHEGHIVKSFFEFIQEDMAEPKNPFRVEPFSVFLVRDDGANAMAVRGNGRYMIVFHTKILQLLDEAIHKRVPNSLEPGDKLKWVLESYFRQTAPSFMFRMVTLFIYYHELAHLNQYKLKDSSNSLTKEACDLVAGREFNEVAHAKEIDADIFAAIQVGQRIFNFWSRIPEQKRDTGQLSAMVSLVSAGIFLFWYSMERGWKDLYFLDSDHPHVLIRTYYIFDCMTSVMKGAGNVGQPLDSIACQRDTFHIVSQLLKESDGNGLIDFWSLFVQNVDAMTDYFKKHMVPISKGIPYLVQWNRPESKNRSTGNAIGG